MNIAPFAKGTEYAHQYLSILIQLLTQAEILIQQWVQKKLVARWGILVARWGILVARWGIFVLKLKPLLQKD